MTRSPYYPPPQQRIEVCANCLVVHAHSLLVTPTCCADPILYQYQKVDTQGRVPEYKAKPAQPKQMALPGTTQPSSYLPPPPSQAVPPAGKIERCAWCDERHAPGPEHCADNQPDDADGWQKPGGSM